MPIHFNTNLLDTFRKRLLSGLALNALSALALQGSVLLSNVAVARMVGLHDFGAYSMLVTTAMTVAGLAQGAAGLVTTKFVGEYLPLAPERVKGVIRMCLQITGLTSGVAALVLFLLGDMFANLFLANQNLGWAVRCLSVAILSQVSVTTFYGGLQGLGAFRAIGNAGIIAGLLHIVLILSATLIWGLPGAILGFTFSSAIRAIVFGRALLITILGMNLPKTSNLPKEIRREVLAFAWPASLAGFVSFPALWSVTAFVARQPDGLKWVAILAVANQIRLIVMQLPQLLNGVTFSVVSRLKGAGDENGIRTLVKANLAASGAIAICLASIVGLQLDFVLGLFGVTFATVEARQVVMIMLIAVLPELIGLAFNQLVQAKGHMWRSLAFIVAPRDLIYLTASAVLFPHFGIIAVASAYVGAQLVACLGTMVIAQN